ncbi:hypothetical protein L596_003384 [Steinernema carpocapsae]|uniref:Ubiquitin-like domain-containing protein n=1 Tax=Steinernema carpocapsae TaxID=34508 RepID=A0A4U8UU00_STECR|nr:hypothetical protein L596_003384 [Steinernema carpocapsae]
MFLLETSVARETTTLRKQIHFKLLKVIVYNKSRQYAGHTIAIDADPTDDVLRLKEKIEEQTKIPTDIQHLLFGISVPQNDKTVEQMGVQEGYTLYSVPTYVEVPSMPNL